MLFVAGVLWACQRGGRHVRGKLGHARQQARTAAASRGGHHDSDAVKRRAARQATVGFWAGEARHGFPVFRHGFEEGWAEHQHEMARRERDRAARQADHAEQQRTWRDEAAGHWRRLDRARGQDGATPPHSADPPLPDGRTPGNGPPAAPARPPAGSNGARPPGGPADSNGAGDTGTGTTTTGSSSTVGDFNYDDTVKTCDDLIAAAEAAVSEQDLNRATGLADGLGAMVPDDSTTLGQAADVAGAIKDVQDANQRLQDTTAALKDRVVKTYGPVQESVDASGERAPQPEFTDH
jgi:hypothetical protein